MNVPAGSSATEAWLGTERILCVRLDALGDVLMTSPAIRAVKESAPRRHVALLTSPSGAAVGRLIPEIDAVVEYDAPWMKATAAGADFGSELRIARLLRRQKFDAAVIFTVYSQSPLPAALLCRLAGIPMRIAHCRENPYALLTDWIKEPEPDTLVRHEVRRQLDLVASIGCSTRDERLRIRIPDDSRARTARTLATAGIDPSLPWIVVHPGATAPSRRYAPEGFARVARALTLDHGYQVLFTGLDDERSLIVGIREAMNAPSASLVGALAVGDFAALLESASLLISNNTGPVHLAAAVGTPVVDLYALTNPQHTPWAVRHRVLSHDVPCKYCYKSVCPEGHHRCLSLVPPESIVEAARGLLG